MEDDGHFSPDLSCQETPTCLESNSDLVHEITTNHYTDIYFDPALQQQHVEILIQKEIDFGFGFGFKNHEYRENRSEAITWILRNRAVLGFRFRTAYLSITYFDLFLTKCSFKGDQSRQKTLFTTLSVACLSLAAKMEEQRRPSLSDYIVEDCIIERRWISQMELAVLAALEWKLDSVTPFAFIDYFITELEFDKESPPETKYDLIEEFLTYLIRVNNLMQHRPSVLAAAVTIMAFDDRLTRDGLIAKTKSFPNLKFLEIEHVCTIYGILQEEKEDNEKLTRPTHSSSLGSDSAKETVTG